MATCLEMSHIGYEKVSGIPITTEGLDFNWYYIFLWTAWVWSFYKLCTSRKLCGKSIKSS